MSFSVTAAKASVNQGAEEVFFDAHVDSLYQLFVALGREHEWADNPEQLLAYTQSRWVGSDHGNSQDKDQFSRDQEEAARAPLAEMGLVDEVIPPSGAYEQVVIVGALMRANRERLAYARRLNIESPGIIFWAGQRLRERRDNDEIGKMNLSSLAANPWIKDELLKPEQAGWESRFATETELAHLAYLDVFDKDAAIQEVARDDKNAQPIPGVPHRTVKNYRLSADPDFVIMNCAAVERPIGSPRHTTESCAYEWMSDLAPSVASRVLVVAGNPHIPRTARIIQRAAQERRPDIELVACGPAARPEASIQLSLGEVGRLIHMDVELLRS